MGARVDSVSRLTALLLCAVWVWLAQAAPIHQAAQKGLLDDLTKLVESDATLLELQDESGATPLHQAVVWNRLEVARYLLEKGADPNVKKQGDLTALHMAASAGNLPMVTLLVERGADPRARDARGRTAVMLAGLKRHYAVVNFLNASLKPEAPASDSTDPPTNTGRIKVTVKTADGVPIANCLVTAIPSASRATTGPEGQAALEVPPGRYSVSATADDFSRPNAQSVEVDANEPVSVTFVLTSPFAILSGRVVNDRGEGVRAVRLRLSPGGSSTATDSDGSYRLARVRRGAYSLSASHPDYPPAMRSGLLLTEGRTEIVNFTLKSRFGAIAGTVLDHEGKVAGGLRVSIPGRPGATTTDREGRFSFLRLEPGAYDLVVEGQGKVVAKLKGVPIEAGVTAPVNVQMGWSWRDLPRPYLWYGLGVVAVLFFGAMLKSALAKAPPEPAARPASPGGATATADVRPSSAGQPVPSALGGAAPPEAWTRLDQLPFDLPGLAAPAVLQTTATLAPPEPVRAEPAARPAPGLPTVTTASDGPRRFEHPAQWGVISRLLNADTVLLAQQHDPSVAGPIWLETAAGGADVGPRPLPTAHLAGALFNNLVVLAFLPPLFLAAIIIFFLDLLTVAMALLGMLSGNVFAPLIAFWNLFVAVLDIFFTGGRLVVVSYRCTRLAVALLTKAPLTYLPQGATERDGVLASFTPGDIAQIIRLRLSPKFLRRHARKKAGLLKSLLFRARAMLLSRPEPVEVFALVRGEPVNLTPVEGSFSRRKRRMREWFDLKASRRRTVWMITVRVADANEVQTALEANLGCQVVVLDDDAAGRRLWV